MDTAVAAGLIKLVCHRQCKEMNDSSVQRLQMGMTIRRVEAKKVIFSSTTCESPFSGWWVMINKPDDSRKVILKELAKVVLAHADPAGRIAGAIGGSVASIQSAHSTVGDFQTVAEMGNVKTMAQGVVDQWNGAWKAGVWDSAKGTRQEFTIGMGYFLLGGFCTISEPDNYGDVVGRTTIWNKEKMLRYMSASEIEGGNDYAIQRLNTRLAFPNTKDFKYSAANHKLKFF